MNGGRFLLLFIAADEAGFTGWLRLDDGAIVARGGDVAAIPRDVEERDPERVVLIVPGVEVLLHWVELPSLASAQAQAAARIMAAEVSATPIEGLHVALGRAAAGLRCMAVVDNELVGRWIGAAQALGYDPDHLLPEPMLILPPEEGVRQWARDGLHVVRGQSSALTAEPALAALYGETPITEIDDGLVEAEMGAAIAAMPVDLRQGAFAKRRRWRVDLGLVRRLAAIAGLIVLAILLIQAVLILRYEADSSRLEGEIERVARRALPRGERIADPSAQMTARLAELRGGGLGFGPMAALLFAAAHDTANIELSQLMFDRDGTLRMTVLGSTDADIAALQRRLEAQGLDVSAGAVRTGGGRQMADLVVTAR